MLRHDTFPPDLVPTLSRGKHRSPRTGACFMEFASYLAGERWSDHPACTHPLLATLARLVNDHTSDAGRGRLVGLVPSVIDTNADDPHVDAAIALRSATTALPVASAERQRALAVAVLAGERVLADLDGRPGEPGELGERSRAALAQAPDAARWARAFAEELGARPGPKAFRRHAASTTVRVAVLGIAEACAADTDALLHDLLAGAIADCAPWCSRPPAGDGEAESAGRAAGRRGGDQRAAGGGHEDDVVAGEAAPRGGVAELRHGGPPGHARPGALSYGY